MTAAAGNRVLDALIERLYASLLRGPALNSHPSNSRQRIDLASLAAFGGDGQQALAALLGPERQYRLAFSNPAPAQTEAGRKENDARRLLTKLNGMLRDGDTIQRDTGAATMFIGYPYLSLPRIAARTYFGTSRLFAPIAFVPVRFALTQGPRPSFILESAATNGTDRVIANVALKTWIERQVGKPYPELFEDEEGEDPYREVSELVAHVGEALGIESPSLDGWATSPIPALRDMGEELKIIPGAVLGLFPLARQGAIRDLEELRAMPEYPPTVAPFLTLDPSLSMVVEEGHDLGEKAMAEVPLVPSAQEHLIDLADPCQRRAVLMARTAKTLVVHGPPGTGKSQTITNIIGDYLARGLCVLMVCEKRTALDVVRHRLEARGLGGLCAVVHDATGDRTALYTGIREQLEQLADAPIPADPSAELARVDREIDALHGELRAFYAELLKPSTELHATVHQLSGALLAALGSTIFEHQEGSIGLESISPELLINGQGRLLAAYARLLEAGFARNQWDGAYRLTLEQFFAKPIHEWETMLQSWRSLAESVSEKLRPEDPPLAGIGMLTEQTILRRELADSIARITPLPDPAIARALTVITDNQLNEMRSELAALVPQRQLVSEAPLDWELHQRWQLAPWPATKVVSSIAVLEEYLAKGLGFLGFFQFAIRRQAREALQPLGLLLNAEAAARVLRFLRGVQARMLLRQALENRIPGISISLVEDTSLTRAVDCYSFGVAALADSAGPQGSPGLCELVREGLRGDTDPVCRALLRQSESIDRAATLISALDQHPILSDRMRDELESSLIAGVSCTPKIDGLIRDFRRLEPLLRFDEELAEFPVAIAAALRTSARAGLDGDAAFSRLLAPSLKGLYQRRLKESPILIQMDASRTTIAFRRLQELARAKMLLETEQIAYDWRMNQRKRLLASTGTRLNSLGADLRRRLMLRGKQATRIRQILHDGQRIEGGDPIFDIHPVWMTSPETAAQIFPPETIFDVVIFDEASQCRLEEGLPVLLRGERIVVAGDTRQLPPTRFFESAFQTNDSDEESLSEEGLFQAQQSDIEDLLTAALNMEVDQSYLDVHYRSRNANLIEFSNHAFYGSRLQAIPAHPNKVTRDPAIRLHQVNGVYAERQNPAEAEVVVKRVQEILSAENPPTIGIVTFNITQRDLIEDALFKKSQDDAAFRSALDAARGRMRDGAYEGLFVKNLENVQGDERDVILVSTTYGPTAEGRFFRRFGPLARAGGERRLNVIVTRARFRVEIMTSIPSEVYRADADAGIPDGQRPNGSMYLMRYLRDAAVMQERMKNQAEGHALIGSFEGPVDSYAQSEFTEVFAELLRTDFGIDSWTYVGNAGFQVDLAFVHPERSDRVTIGVLFDTSRYSRAQDPVEWDGFRTGILERQSWELYRVWTPHFFRDPRGTIERLLAAAAENAKRGV